MQLRDTALFRQQCFIAGSWNDADSGATSAIVNPATGAMLGHVPQLGAAETRRAIEAAHAALPGWRALTAPARARGKFIAFDFTTAVSFG